MKRYDAYKDIEFAAISSIPTHWDVKKFRHIARFAQRKNRDAVDRPMLSLSAYRGVEIKHYDDENMARTKEESFEYCIVKPNQLVINPMWVIYGAIGVSKYHGIVSPAYRVYSLSNDIVPSYCDYLLKSHFYIKDYNRYIRGLTTYDRSVRKEDFHEILVLLPPRAEQNAIVAFLDHKLAEIDRFIANKKRLIELLKEQKAALINRAVTRGIEPDVRMKPSGIEWLGEIPAHWEVKRAKYFFREINERSETGSEELLSVSHITGVTPRSEKNINMFMAESYEGYKTCQPDDLVINIMWSWMGAAGVSRYSGIVSSAYGVYRQIRKTFDWQYLDYLVRTKAYIAEFTCRSTGIQSSRLRMYTEDFFDIPIIVPSLVEQQDIIHSINRETKRIDAVITTIEREIELIKEYRTTLISEAVTGKIDVRTAHREELPVEAGRSSHHELERYVGNGPRGSD